MPKKVSKKNLSLIAVLLILSAAIIVMVDYKNKQGEGHFTESNCEKMVAGKLYDNAVSCYGRLLEADANNFQAKADLGRVYYETKNYEDASKLFKEALDQNSDPFMMNNLANSLRDQGKIAEAEEYYLKAIAVGNDDSITNLVTIYNSSGEYEKSIKILDEELEKKPNDGALLRLLASTYSKQGNSTKANEIIKQIK